MDNKMINVLGRKLWDYHHMNHKLEKADCIMVLGSYDLRVAERGTELYLKGWAPLLVFSGGLGKQTKYMWKEAEADLFADIARSKGVPESAILIENKSTNTGENVLFTKQLLEKKGLNPQRFILVQKPYMERRSYATFKKNWPEKEAIVTSPQLSFEDYPSGDITFEKMMNSMVGDLQRIKVYPEKGFQIPQEIPADVWEAWEQLVKEGFDKDVMKG